jgi:hypothetical protein
MEFTYGLGTPKGTAVTVDMTITPKNREAIFARLRPFVEPGRAVRVTVGPTKVVVEGLTDGEADSVREVLDQLVLELNPDAAPKRVRAGVRAQRSAAVGV